MSDGFGYRIVLSKEECVSRLNEILNVIKKDYAFLWKGNPSLISKYGTSGISNLDVDSGKQLIINKNLPDATKEGFVTLGIVKKKKDIEFYLGAPKGKTSLISNGLMVYNILQKQFDFSTKSGIDFCAKGLYENLEDILSRDLKEKLKIE